MSNAPSDWTTLLEVPAAIREQGNYDKDVHSVFFLPVSENILGRSVALLIPECELQVVEVVSGEPQVVINRPRQNKSVRRWLRFACEIATEKDCPLSLACDTHDQAERVAAMAVKRLPNHRRIAVERMYQPETRTFKGLS